MFSTLSNFCNCTSVKYKYCSTTGAQFSVQAVVTFWNTWRHRQAAPPPQRERERTCPCVFLWWSDTHTFTHTHRGSSSSSTSSSRTHSIWSAPALIDPHGLLTSRWIKSPHLYLYKCQFVASVCVRNRAAAMGFYGTLKLIFYKVSIGFIDRTRFWSIERSIRCGSARVTEWGAVLSCR